MRSIKVERHKPAPVAAVWDVLSRLPAISTGPLEETYGDFVVVVARVPTSRVH